MILFNHIIESQQKNSWKSNYWHWINFFFVVHFFLVIIDKLRYFLSDEFVTFINLNDNSYSSWKNFKVHLKIWDSPKRIFSILWKWKLIFEFFSNTQKLNAFQNGIFVSSSATISSVHAELSTATESFWTTSISLITVFLWKKHTNTTYKSYKERLLATQRNNLRLEIRLFECLC